MKRINEADDWSEEAILRMLKARRPKPEPAPRPAVVTRLDELSIETQRKATQRSMEQLARREREEAERLATEARQKEWLVAQRQAAIDAFMERQLAEKAIQKAWNDPMGLWGPMTLASKLD